MSLCPRDCTVSGMTQEQITADEYRTAAKVLRTKQVSDALGVYAAESKWCDTQAARLDAQAAGEAYEWDLALAYTAGYSTQADRPYSGGDDCRRAGIRIVLAKLEADGRLVPAGGKALTAEQWDDVKQSIDISSIGPFRRRLRTLVEEEEKAARSPQPASADRCRCGVLEDEPSDGCEWHAARAERAAESWATWQEVPEGVTFRTDKVRGATWNRARTIAVTTNACGRTPGGLNAYGPFVRAEAGKPDA